MNIKETKDPMAVGQIYKIYFADKNGNLLTSKMYIGQTTSDLKERLIDHKKPISKLRIGTAIQEYGIENTYIETVQSVFKIKELTKLEQEYIDKYNTADPNGFNRPKKSNGVAKEKKLPVIELAKKEKKPIVKERVSSQATKDKISKSLRGKKYSKETVLRRVESRRLKQLELQQKEKEYELYLLSLNKEQEKNREYEYFANVMQTIYEYRY